MITVFPYFFPARGRKPTAISRRWELLQRVFPYFFPARGRKQFRLERFRFHLFGFSLLFPRKGTETRPTSSFRAGWGFRFSLLFPRKGTETKETFLFLPSPTNRSFFPTFSPQGDGNRIAFLIVIVLIDYVFPYFFPARGRKRH